MKMSWLLNKVFYPVWNFFILLCLFILGDVAVVFAEETIPLGRYFYNIESIDEYKPEIYEYNKAISPHLDEDNINTYNNVKEHRLFIFDHFSRYSNGVFMVSKFPIGHVLVNEFNKKRYLLYNYYDVTFKKLTNQLDIANKRYASSLVLSKNIDQTGELEKEKADITYLEGEMKKLNDKGQENKQMWYFLVFQNEADEKQADETKAIRMFLHTNLGRMTYENDSKLVINFYYLVYKSNVGKVIDDRNFFAYNMAISPQNVSYIIFFTQIDKVFLVNFLNYTTFENRPQNSFPFKDKQGDIVFHLHTDVEKNFATLLYDDKKAESEERGKKEYLPLLMPYKDGVENFKSQLPIPDMPLRETIEAHEKTSIKDQNWVTEGTK